MGKSTISVAIVNSHVSLPEGSIWITTWLIQQKRSDRMGFLLWGMPCVLLLVAKSAQFCLKDQPLCSWEFGNSGLLSLGFWATSPFQVRRARLSLWETTCRIGWWTCAAFTFQPVGDSLSEESWSYKCWFYPRKKGFEFTWSLKEFSSLKWLSFSQGSGPDSWVVMSIDTASWVIWGGATWTKKASQVTEIIVTCGRRDYVGN